MCGIIGCINSEKAGRKVLLGLDIIKNRGRDSYGITDGKNIHYLKYIQELPELQSSSVIGHCLHSIVGYLPQPLTGIQSCFASNCEIYNWKELAEKHNIPAHNDSDLLFRLIEKQGIEKTLHELDGVYAFVYWKKDQVILCRDKLGVKPLWFSCEKGLAFASEKKALEKIGCLRVEELNPRHQLNYNIVQDKLSFRKRSFLELAEHTLPKQDIIKELEGRIISAVSKRIPDQKFGILFSGGIDSLIIAFICSRLGVDFTCYTAALDEKGMEPAQDLVWARKTAAKLGFRLNEARIALKDVPALLKKTVPLIEDTNVVKAGVGLAFYTACRQARKDKIRVIFSGLGSEELFAGYDRHKKTLESSDISRINEDCLWGLVKIYERDTYRDDVITMNNRIELRIPFLDYELCRFALNIPAKYKLNTSQSKIILRETAIKMGLPEEFAWRKKTAAQYGSKFDRALEVLAKREKLKKSQYLRRYYPQPNLKLGALFSSGKDSNLAVYIMQQRNYDVCCLITLNSLNPDSYMFHTPAIELVRLQSQALRIPLVEVQTSGEKEIELADMENAIAIAKKQHGIQGVVTGALFSNYQRERIERVCDKLGLKIFAPLWHLNQEDELRELLKNNFEFVMSGISAEGLDKTWLNRRIGEEECLQLKELNRRIGFNVAGEGGEYESLVLFGPNYSKRIMILDYDVEESGIAARMLVKKAVLA